MNNRKTPLILVPYSGPSNNSNEFDVFIYMRPETNGVVAESIITQVIEKCPEYRKKIKLVYLVNIPGKYIVEEGLIEKYNALKIYFARKGRGAFTQYMQKEFERFFKESWESATILGAYEAIEELKYSAEELFNLWVDEKSVLCINEQTIKKVGNYYIVNYDIPALLKKNNNYTNIAVMLFRMHVSYGYIDTIAEKIASEMVVQNVLPRGSTPTRAFHYSHGPFEQIRDGLLFLLNNNAEYCTLGELSFGKYLLSKGVSQKSIQHLIENPLVKLSDHNTPEEVSIFLHTRGFNYQSALNSLYNITSQNFINL